MLVADCALLIERTAKNTLLTNCRRTLLACSNVSPTYARRSVVTGVASEAMLLAADREDASGRVVRMLEPPPGSQPGDQ
eukprot:1118702-Pelagomonas_calceolata.AAC.1